MFGADLPYNLYIQEEEPQTENGWNFDLEEYLSPHTQIPHPWNQQLTGETQLDMDFILVAEFSELEGPREVLTIPRGGSSNFNITDFSVRIMSLDHQTTTKQGFHLIEDSQVMFSEIKDNVFAFVHHFALYDRHARGYVRPFAISYITPDNRKLLHFYDEICQQMKKVVRYLKYGNRLVFKNNLEMHLMDLHYTKAEMLLRMRSRKLSQPFSEDIFYRNLRSLETNITETQNVLHTIKQSLVDKKLEHRFARLEVKAKVDIPRPKSDSCSLQEWEEIENSVPVSNLSGSYGSSPENSATLFPDTRFYRPKSVKITSGRQFDIHLQGLHELCSWGHREGMQKLRHLYQFFRRDMAVLQVESSDKIYNDPSSSALHFGEDCIGANLLTNIDKKCMGCQCLHAEIPELFKKCSSRSMETLSFKSAASSFRSVVDDDDAESMKSAFSATGSPSVNFSLNNDSEMTDNSEENIDISSRNEVIRQLQFKIQKLQTLRTDNFIDAGRENGNSDGIENFHNKKIDENSEISETDIGNSEEETELSSSMILSTSTLVWEEKEMGEEKEEGSDTTDEREAMCECNSSDEETDEKRDRLQTITAENVGQQENESESKEDAERIHVSVLAQSLKIESTVEHDSEGITSYKFIRQNIENLIPVDTPEQDSVLFPVTSDNMACGFGLLHVMTKYASIKHVIYSILIGQSVIVVGTPDLEEEVKNIVKALKIFLTSYHRNHKSFIPWTRCMPSICKMSDIKLLGVCRPERKPMDRFIPAVIRKLCTVFDVRKREVFCPIYQGYYLSLLDNRVRNYKMEEMLTTLIKSILVDLSSKAFIYFHAFCIGPAGKGRQDYRFIQQQSSSFQRTVSNFMAKIGIHDSDMHIVEFLCETIKHQLIEDHFQSRAGVPNMPMKPVTIQHSLCSQMMKC
ncbi:guanine nucleotide exchange protein SMCR8-like [Saccostrea echinata]|uniref:guanine nucleotide exchange protein SMCR8-like n=1 Tax=Saccostrea echinata TaxID=191078 RepID=UPI002A806B05|nr:guanine nucleotide exchange protein SMCR8-like [Saccostrea echinata]